MSDNISYNNDSTADTLTELVALRKTLTARLIAENKKLYTYDWEIQLLKRQNELLRDHLYKQVSLLKRLNSRNYRRL